MRELAVVGWREWIALPELGVEAVKAKIDTGARSAALHAWDLEIVERDGQPWARFAVHPFQRDDTTVIPCEAPVVDERDVRSSNGEVERRPVIATDLCLVDRHYRIELSLTRRDEMGFRVLLGRRALRRRFVVDPGRSFLAGGTTVAPPSPRSSA